MKTSVKEISSLVGGQVFGNEETVLCGVAGLKEATPSDLSFLRDLKKAAVLKLMAETHAGAIIVPNDLPLNEKTVIKVKNPMAAFSKVLGLIEEEKKVLNRSVHPSASVASTAQIGKNVSIGPFSVIEDGVVLGDDVVVMAQVYIGPHSKIGRGSLLYPQVVIREECQIGEFCILHAGCVVGSDGYGFYFSEGRHNKIPQIGNVVIEDHVEIGSCSAVDRAMIGSTLIKRGTKIDNLVQVAHNVEIGEHCLLAAHVGVAGSTVLGPGVVMAGQAGVGDHMKIGAGAQIGGQAGVNSEVKPGEILFGTYAQPLNDFMRQTILIRRLPELFKDVRRLKKEIGK